ncbi:hypothetical protein EWB00_004921 [Schistosoma japonicum]|uniref:SJCHGC02281 protein n=1 Tax=Schistosoma japonicum TaxID=6182 RepID=Q5DFU9_SCHJA|nr:SJCHGC02281 protein [Schistosoma japonicum]TNN11063.1 hypothetical protein EWB00_004921 [Schistosoma japonicum]
MEYLDNVGEWENQSSSCRNTTAEIQLDSARNQRNPLDSSWTQNIGYRKDATILRPQTGKCSTHTLGVLLMLFTDKRTALVGWESYGPSIIKASFKTMKKGITMNIIQSYALTNHGNDEDKDQLFCERS